MSKNLKFASRSHLADMSRAPAERGRKKKKKGAGTKGVTAQLAHANGSPRVNGLRRKWEKQAARGDAR